MPRNLGWIRQFHQPESPDSPLLLVFPHAGAGASAYRAFSKLLSKNFSVIVFQYPGRQDRAAEPLLGSIPDIAAGAFAEFAESEHNRGVPLVTFGHSLGAMVSFEFVRLAEAAGIGVRHLNVSAAVAPCYAAAKPPHPTSDEEILQHISILEGTNAAVSGNNDLMRLALPVIKADYQAFDAYSCSERVKISAPIHALGGDQDPIVKLGDLYGWGKHTGAVQVTMFDGGHFYIDNHHDAIAEVLVASARSELTEGSGTTS